MAKSKSQASTSSSQSSSTTDNRIAADGGSFVAGQGSNVRIETLADDVAIAALREAGDVAETGLTAGVHLGNIAADTAKTVNADSLDFASTVNADSLDFAGNIVDTASSLLTRQIQATEKASGNVTDVAALALAGMERNKADPTNQTVQDVAKYATAAVAVVALAYLFTRRN